MNKMMIVLSVLFASIHTSHAAEPELRVYRTPIATYVAQPGSTRAHEAVSFLKMEVRDGHQYNTFSSEESGDVFFTRISPGGAELQGESTLANAALAFVNPRVERIERNGRVISTSEYLGLPVEEQAPQRMAYKVLDVVVQAGRGPVLHPYNVTTFRATDFDAAGELSLAAFARVKRLLRVVRVTNEGFGDRRYHFDGGNAFEHEALTGKMVGTKGAALVGVDGAIYALSKSCLTVQQQEYAKASDAERARMDAAVAGTPAAPAWRAAAPVASTSLLGVGGN